MKRQGSIDRYEQISRDKYIEIYAKISRDQRIQNDLYR